MTIETVYKYRPISADTMRILVYNELYFSLPENLNDPFDCNIVPTQEVTTGEFDQWLRQNFPGQPEQKYQEAISKYLNNLPKDLSESLKHELDSIKKEIVLSCFSEVNNSTLMFSHYADSHKGLCLQFKVMEHPFFDRLFPVDYPDVFPSIKFFDKNFEVMMKAQFLTKEPAWKYEREYRILKAHEPPGFVKFPPEALTGIILGLRTSDADISMIMELTKYRQPKIDYYTCTRANDSFNLNVILV